MTPRQKALLNAIIQEFIDTAEAVGSLHLPSKYKINASPATIRNEMAKLVELGFLEKPHSSSGRIPTTTGIKYYLEELIDALEDIEYSREAKFKEQMHQSRFNKKEIIIQSLRFLTEITNNASVALIDQNLFHYGLSTILDQPEFQDISKLKSILRLLEDYSILYDVFESYSTDRNIKVLVGEETGISDFEKYAVVFTPIKFFGDTNGYLAVIGPNRMRYKAVIPALRTIANNIESVVRGW